MESAIPDDYIKDEMANSLKLARCVDTKILMKTLKNTVDINYSSKEDIQRIMNEVGQGFGFYIGVLYECCTMENQNENFLDTRNGLILDIYTYMKEVVPIIVSILRKARTMCDIFFNLKMEELVQNIDTILEIGGDLNILLEFVTYLHKKVVTLETERLDEVQTIANKLSSNLQNILKEQEKQFTKLGHIVDAITQIVEPSEFQGKLKTLIRIQNPTKEQQQVEALLIIKSILTPALEVYLESLKKLNIIINGIYEKSQDIKQKQNIPQIQSSSKDISNMTITVIGLYNNADCQLDALLKKVTKKDLESVIGKQQKSRTYLYGWMIRQVQAELLKNIKFEKLVSILKEQELTRILDIKLPLKIDFAKKAIEGGKEDYGEENDEE